MYQKDYLIYCVCGYDPVYAQLTEICVRSVIATNHMEFVDIVILCDEKYSYFFKKLCADFPFCVNLCITEENTQPAFCAMRKLEVFNIPGIMNYKRVLFLDSDIIVCNDLTRVFMKPFPSDVLQVYHELSYQNPHRHPLFSMNTYSAQDIQRLEAEGRKGFNTGQFMFRPCEIMKRHFTTILETMKKEKSFTRVYEQCFINVHFNSHGKTDSSILQPIVRLCCHCLPDKNPHRFDPDRYIVHFCGTPSTEARTVMQFFYKVYLEKCRQSDTSNVLDVSPYSHEPCIYNPESTRFHIFKKDSQSYLIAKRNESGEHKLQLALQNAKVGVDEKDSDIYEWSLIPAENEPHVYEIHCEELGLVIESLPFQDGAPGHVNGVQLVHKTSAICSEYKENRKWFINRLNGGEVLIVNWNNCLALDDTGVKTGYVSPHLWAATFSNVNQRFSVKAITTDHDASHIERQVVSPLDMAEALDFTSETD